jgi:hypothetical protein
MTKTVTVTISMRQEDLTNAGEYVRKLGYTTVEDYFANVLRREADAIKMQPAGGILLQRLQTLGYM